MRKMLFPAFHGQRYYKMHYAFVESLARNAGIEVELALGIRDFKASFEIVYNYRPILIDFYDFPELAPAASHFDAVFKFHYSPFVKYPANVFPLTPISFNDWPRYFELAHEIKYRAEGDLVLNCQTPYGGGRDRRMQVRHILMNAWPRLDFSITDQERFWRKVGECLVAVCVPGARPNILDRGQFQYMAFGACTISPPLDIMLPGNIFLVPNYTHITCRNDFADLIEKIKWCQGNRAKCIQMGRNAKRVFEQYCTPAPVWAWIDKCLEAK